MPSAAPPLPPDLDLETATVAQLAERLRSGSVTSVALVTAYLDRIEAVDRAGPALRSIRAVNPAALDEAEAADAARRAGAELPPLHGLPVVIKDNVDVAGLPTTAGSLALAESKPPADAFLVRRLQKAGLVVLAKANLTEMANFLTDGMPSGYSSLGGQVLNPYDAALTPSGSSSGSAVCVAAGLAPLAVGTETNGSILSPADHCSVVGVKPTTGLVSRAGIVPISHTQDTAGPMATDVAGAAALLAALAGPDPDDEATAGQPPEVQAGGPLVPGTLTGARVGVVRGDPGPGADAAWLSARQALVAAGATAVPVELQPMPRKFFVLTYEFGPDLDRYFATLGPDAPVGSHRDLLAFYRDHPREAAKFGFSRLAASAAVDHDDPDVQATYRRIRRADLDASRGQLDSLLVEEQLDALLFAGAGSADPGARAGYPSVALPAGYADGTRRPFGVTLLGPAWSDWRLLGYALDLERAGGWRRPPSEINPASFRPVERSSPAMPARP